MKWPVKTCSQTVQVTSALQRMFPLSFYIDIHSINVSVYLCNCKQIATAMWYIPHITWTVYLHIMIRTVHICTLVLVCVHCTVSYKTWYWNEEWCWCEWQPTVFKSTRMMSFSVYVVSSQHWAYLWLAYPLYCIVSLPCFCLLQVYINQGVRQAHVHKTYSKL